MAGKDGEIKIDAETLSKQEGVSEAQSEAIALEAIKEIEAGKAKKTPEDLAKEAAAEQGKESQEDASQKENTEPTAEETAAKEKEEKEAKDKEEERILNAKEEELSEEDKVKKGEIVKAREDSKTKAAQEEVSAYAKEHNVSEDEAREDLESIAKIQEKYKGDPKQLAKANLHLQRLYSKNEAEVKALKDAKPAVAEIKEVPIEAVEKWIEDGKITVGGKQITKEGVIEAYRAAYPDLTDSLDDEKVFKLAAKETKEKIDKHNEGQKVEIASKAKEKRATIFDTLSEADKKYIPEIKPFIEKLTDSQIMDERFELETYVTFAKGKAFETTIKRLEEEKKAFGEKEFKRGQEEAKILGVRRPPNGNAPKVSVTSLTDEDKKRAREMFDNPDITEDQAYKLYADYLKEIKQ